MSFAVQSSKALLPLLLAVSVVGCEEPAQEGAPAASAKAKASATAAPSAAPTASAKPPEPRDDCPEGSAGPGTFDLPCKATGISRLMEVKWTGKIEDKGPKFSVANLTDKVITYGSVVVYFYDKDGKQLKVGGDNPKPFAKCAGSKIFGEAVKAKEKFAMYFSCVSKSKVPEGTEAMEAEIVMVGFADESGKKTEYFWSNKNLTPDERPKGGVKEKKDKKK